MSLKLLVDPVTDAILGVQGVGGDGVDKRIDVIATAMRAGMRASELAAGVIAGAVNIPLDELRERHGELPAGPLVVHCMVGQRGNTAALILAHLGFTVSNLDGGFLSWHRGMRAQISMGGVAYGAGTTREAGAAVVAGLNWKALLGKADSRCKTCAMTSKEFKIVHETEIEGAPEQVFEAAHGGTSGWMWPMEIEPKLGGAGPFGSTVTVWDPPHHYANRMDGEGGYFNQLEFNITELADGKSWLRYVHSGVFFEDWDNQYDGAAKHTAFYLHTLGQYVQYFAGRQAAFADVQGPAASSAPDAFGAVRAALGIHDPGAGGHVSLAIEGLETVDTVVDYLDENFVGLRTEDAMIRFFGRNAFGAVVGMTVHLFAEGADAEAAGAAWGAWLNGLYA